MAEHGRIQNDEIKKKSIELGHHPESWKTAKGVVIPKPGKPDYTQVRAHRVISLLDSISKLVERTAAHLERITWSGETSFMMGSTVAGSGDQRSIRLRF